VTTQGSFYPLTEAWAHPVPEPPPPILIGARTPAGVRLAARIGDGWAAESDVFEVLAPAYQAALVAAGRDRATQRVLVGFGSGRAGQDALRGSPWVTDPAAEWSRWQQLGADVVTVTARTTADVDGLVEAVQRW
jgi:alkanesulfonate monooxygenase SsuD/methylene tetrahydromethanopterin reductase-like flavin-dependent oxidoreductase (luciferase family)